nr:retrovirus-related Pol polyprotein from transposon TNT 1-94 [Tanacetum cinerariifolium]
DNKRGTSTNTKFAKQSILGKPPKVGEIHALSKPVTLNSIPTPRESNVVKTDQVIAPGMCRINPFKTSREEKHVPNTVRASVRTKPITVSQPPVFTKKDVNSDSNGLSSTGIDNTKTRKPQPRSNTKNDRVPSASTSSCNKNKGVEVEEHHRNLLLSKNKKHMSSACKKIKLDSHNIISKVIYAMCKQCLISVNHDVCLHNYVNGKTSRGKKQKENVSINEKQKKQQLKVKKTEKVIQICLWCIDSGCSKHMTGNLKLLINFVWKFMGTVRFRNDRVAAILGFGDLQWRNILITGVYFVEGLGHNLFSVGQFCDSDLEVAFRRNACFVRSLEGVDLLKRDRSTNIYTINLHDMAYASPICLMARASSTKSWLWHQRLSHLNFDTINDLTKNDLVTGLPKFKYHKEHLCPSCEQEKSKRASHPPKPVPNSRQRLHLLHMDLCGPMRIASINGKRYVLVIVDDYSRYTWVHFLRSKDEAPEVIKTFLKRITILLQSPVIIIRTDNGTEFKNQALKEYCDNVGISHQVSSRLLLRVSLKIAPLFAVNKTPYELINGRKPDISFRHVFGALCYPKNDREDIGKLGAKGDIGFFIGYSADSCAYRVYNRRYTQLFFDLMKSRFDMSMMGEMTFFLGLQVNQSPCGIFLNPSNYVLEILKKYGMESCDPVGTPMEIKDKLDLDQNGTPVDATKYRSMIGALMYLTSSRPDIDYGFELTGFSDVDYAGCKDTFKSISGGAHFLGEKLEHVEKGTIELYFVKTDYQLADLFTKALPVDRFNYLVRRLGMRSLSPQELDRLAKSQ